MKFRCPTCSVDYLPENINIQTDLALCKHCGQMARLSEQPDTDDNLIDLQNPPKGAWYRQAMSEVVIGGTTRSGSAFMLVPFTCVWAGGSLGGIYGSQLASGKFEPFLAFFGLPFLVGSIFLIGTTIMAVCGKVELRLRGGQGIVFVGVGQFGWKRPFNLDEINSITEQDATKQYPGSGGGCIVLEGKTRLRFATGLTETRRYFMLHALKRLHARQA